MCFMLHWTMFSSEAKSKSRGAPTFPLCCIAFSFQMQTLQIRSSQQAKLCCGYKFTHPEVWIFSTSFILGTSDSRGEDSEQAKSILTMSVYSKAPRGPDKEIPREQNKCITVLLLTNAILTHSSGKDADSPERRAKA